MPAQAINFKQAVDVALHTVPGLRHDMNIIAERRKNDSRDMEGIGRWGLEIPDPIMPLLQLYWPNIFNQDTDISHREWLKFMNHPDSEQFRVKPRL